MEISELTLRLILLFFPGIIWFLVVDALAVHRRFTSFRSVLLSYVLGGICYVVYGLGHWLLVRINEVTRFGAVFSDGTSFLETLANKDSRLNFFEIATVSVLVAPAVGIAISACWNHKVLHRVANRLRVTYKFADPNVWTFTFTSPDVRWVVVRDLKHGLVYEGWARAFSDVAEKPSLLLRDVRVYANTGPADQDRNAQCLYEVSALFISREWSEIIVEVPWPKVADQGDDQHAPDTEMSLNGRKRELPADTPTPTDRPSGGANLEGRPKPSSAGCPASRPTENSVSPSPAAEQPAKRLNRRERRRLRRQSGQ